MANRKSFGATPKSGRSPFVSTPGDLLPVKECTICSCKLSSKDQELHRNFCNLIRENLPDAIEKGEHGFILASTLHAIVTEIELKPEDWPSKVPDAKNRVLLMNEAAMEQLTISDGDIVLVTLADLKTTLFAYSNSSIKGLCKVALPDLIHNRYTECHSLCSVKKVSFKQVASKVHVSLESCDEEASTERSFDEIKSTILLRKLLAKLIIFKGMQGYFDKLKFTVINVSTEEDLSDEISKLNIQDDQMNLFQMNQSSRIFVQNSVKIFQVSMKHVAGLKRQVDLMNKFIVYPLMPMNHELKSIQPVGIILYGFSGTGKTLTVNAFINEHRDSLFCIQVDPASLNAKSAEASVQKLASVFTLAIDQAPSVIFIDKVEKICSAKKTPSDTERQLSDMLQVQFESLFLRQKRSPDGPMVTVVGITNQLHSIDACFIGLNKFEKYIEFPIPKAEDRQEIMTTLLSSVSHDIPSSLVSEITADAFGFTGADLETALKGARYNAILEGRKLNTDDLRENIGLTKPSAMKEIILEVPSVRWSEIGGGENIKRTLIQMVEWPFKYSEFFRRRKTVAKKGILLYGPPGCSKTLIGKALATEYKLNFLSIKGPELFNKYVGESEKAVRDLFERARQAAPSIIFFDEIDALASVRTGANGNSNVSDRVVTQLLTELDGIEARSEVIVIGATNRPEIVDAALKRPGRFDSEIYVPLPDEHARLEIFKISTRYMPLDESVDLNSLAQQTAGYSGAEIDAVCRNADFVAVASVIDNLPAGQMPAPSDGKITMDMFTSSLKLITPRTSKKMIQFFEMYSKNCDTHETSE